MDWKALARDVSLAALAAFAGAIVSADQLDTALLIAAGYAALRAAAGVVVFWAKR